MSDAMLYVTVASILGLFLWAGYEYAKAGLEYWRAGAARRKEAERTATEASDLIAEPAQGSPLGCSGENATSPADSIEIARSV